ncbi:MAG: RsmE family RNA methyltransferase [Gemmatimonadota bacterium]
MERELQAHIATYYAPGAWGDRVELAESAAHHATVKRASVGDAVGLSSGDGRLAVGVIAELSKKRLVIAVDPNTVERIAAPPRVELWAPVGDRDRMLLLAEKTVELGVSVWQPVVYARSRSVVPRGEGESFREKVRSRQVSALEQSGSAWLPESFAESPFGDRIAADAAGAGASRLLLDAQGPSIVELLPALHAPVRIALGPEGGLEEEERERFLQAGWQTVSLGANVLRFETAGIAAVAMVRSHLR